VVDRGNRIVAGEDFGSGISQVQRKRCIPALADSVRAGRTQYMGTLKSFGLTTSGWSALEKLRTTCPDAASTISRVTAPFDALPSQ